jgi:hypothetical protein
MGRFRFSRASVSDGLMPHIDAGYLPSHGQLSLKVVGRASEG